MPSAPRIKGLYHFSFPCRDAEETRAFYEDLLGLPLVNCMQADRVPSTGEEKPYAHFFFEMGDGSYIAFFDLRTGEMPKPSPNTPAWVMHFAVEVASVDDVAAEHARLTEAGLAPRKLVDFQNNGVPVAKFFFVADPDGYQIEVLQRAGRFQ